MSFADRQICADSSVGELTFFLPSILLRCPKGAFIANIISNAPFYPSNYIMHPYSQGGTQKYGSLLAVVPMPAVRNPHLVLCSAVVSPVLATQVGAELIWELGIQGRSRTGNRGGAVTVCRAGGTQGLPRCHCKGKVGRCSLPHRQLPEHGALSQNNKYSTTSSLK